MSVTNKLKNVLISHSRLFSATRIRSYHQNVIDHYKKPRNVGSFDEKDPTVGTGLVGSPACGDVKIGKDNKIVDSCFKTFGCASAIASSSYATTILKGKEISKAKEITNKTISEHLCLPPIKLHCSMLAEEAIEAAVKDVMNKKRAATVYVYSDVKKSTLDVLFAAASGIMISSSCFGLIEPGLEAAEEEYGNDKFFNNALILTIGLCIQNFPEGMAVAFPLRKCKMDVFKSFWYGQLSGAVEPIGAIIGVLLTRQIQSLLPYALGFAAGAMLYVTVGEMIPDAFSSSENKTQKHFGFAVGFLIMAVLEGIFE